MRTGFSILMSLCRYEFIFFKLFIIWILNSLCSTESFSHAIKKYLNYELSISLSIDWIYLTGTWRQLFVRLRLSLLSSSYHLIRCSYHHHLSFFRSSFLPSFLSSFPPFFFLFLSSFLACLLVLEFSFKLASWSNDDSNGHTEMVDIARTGRSLHNHIPNFHCRSCRFLLH